MSEQNKKLKVWAGSLDKQQMKYFIDFIKDAGYDHTLIFKHEINNYDFQSGETIAALRGWNAATAEANKRIDALESEVAELKELVNKYDKRNVELQEIAFKRDSELQASNHDLREALKYTLYSLEGRGIPAGVDPANLTVQYHKCKNILQQALSATPAESLQAFENEVIERCAVAMENYHVLEGIPAMYIRALKKSS